MHYGICENRVAVKWQWPQLSGAIAAQQDSWEGGGRRVIVVVASNSDNQPVAMATAGTRSEVKLGNGNTVTR